MSIKAPTREPKNRLYVGKLDMSSPATLENFRKVAAAYTAKAIKSKASAIRTLQREGILDKSGNLAERYRSS